MAYNKNFDDYYFAIYGSRWETLRKSLLEDTKTVAFSDGLLRSYNLDYASVLVAYSLRLPESGTILDACAAPGGKSLVILSRMNSKHQLLANDFSTERRRRLLNVLNEYVKLERRSMVNVSGFDTATLGSKKTEHGRFSAILLDAPCSSERHVIQNKKALSEWTSARPRFLAQRQWALISSSFLLLKNESSLVYSTCAISIEENDGVISRLIKKYKGAVLLDEPDFSEGEKTHFGRIILPDVCCGMGPIYIARFRKSI